MIDWKEGKHTFDLRIYLAQHKGLVIPIGGLGRIARGNYIKGLDKQEFVVNLSGYDGQVEVERGIGFSKETCKLLNLEEEDFINITKNLLTCKLDFSKINPFPITETVNKYAVIYGMQ